MKIALAGNPNSGKTTLFNAITGRTEYVGNWPGVTVEKKEADLKRVFRKIANKTMADVKNGSVNNGMFGNDRKGSNDRKSGNDRKGSNDRKGVNNGMGGNDRIRVVDLPGAYSISPFTSEEAITRDFVTGEKPDVIINIIDCSSLERSLFFTTQLLELGVPMVIALNKVDIIRRHGDKIDVEGLSNALRCRIVEVSANEGEGLDRLIAEAVRVSVQDKEKLPVADTVASQAEIDSVPAVAAELRGSIGNTEAEKSSVAAEVRGSIGSTEIGSVPAVAAELKESIGNTEAEKSSVAAELKESTGSAEIGNIPAVAAELNESSGVAEAEKPADPDYFDRARQAYVKGIAGKYFVRKRSSNELTFSDKADRVIAHPVFGLIIFAVIMWGVYAFSINGIGGWASGYINDVLFAETIPNVMNSFFESIDLSPILQALIVDGAVGGVGAVLGFIPLIMVLFFCLALLEDSGYMARVAVVMDRYFKKIGLSGKSIIPMIVGTGCSIPGVMATRTIENDTERRITTMLTPFVPCGAKLPIIALFAAVFFPGATWVFPGMYVLAGLVIIAGGVLLKKLYKYEGENVSSFILELPEYKLPSLKHALRQMLKQAMAFLRKAATIILVMNTLVWFMQMYGWNLQPVEDQSMSILAAIGGVVAPLLIPLGLAGWQMASSIVTGFIAKENVVATLAILLAASEDTLYSATGPLVGMFTPVTAFAFIAFNLFAPPCFAAVGAMNSELGGRRWIFKALLFQLGVGYTVAMLITQIGTLLVYGKPAEGAVISIIIAVILVSLFAFGTRKRSGKVLKTSNTVREGNVL